MSRSKASKRGSARKKPPAAKAPQKKTARARTPREASSAEPIAKKQREISVSEFFAKNRHLLGFDNPSKALLTTVKELVDNSLDAADEANIPADVEVRID